MSDLIIVNADIITLDPACPEASAVAVKNGLISAIGDEGALIARKTAHTRVMDLAGKTLCPGFIDPHLHFRAMAESMMNIDLSPQEQIVSIGDILDRLHQVAFTTPFGRWIRGAGYNEVYLVEKRHPDRWDLDRVSPAHPVKLTHRSTYAHVLNSRALKEVGINRFTDDPDGGIIERDLETGEPTGILFAMGAYLNQRIPELEDKELLKGAQWANDQLLSFGITSFQDASSRNDEIRFQWMEDLKQSGILRPRAVMMMGFDWFNRVRENGGLNNRLQQHVTLRGVKVIIDETTGKLFPGQKELNDMILSIHGAGQQAAVHAIEDTAIEAALRAFENALAVYPKRDHRHRIEHCSVCPPSVCRKIAALGIHVVTHPAFVYYSGDRYLKTVPDHQIKHLYPISELIKAGADVSAASDGPIIKADPVSGIYGAVTRRTQTGETVPGSECISAHEALGLYTRMAAKAGFQEALKGSVTKGKYADFVVLSENPTTIPAEEIKDIEVEMTIIGGEIAWSGKGRGV